MPGYSFSVQFEKYRRYKEGFDRDFVKCSKFTIYTAFLSVILGILNGSIFERNYENVAYNLSRKARTKTSRVLSYTTPQSYVLCQTPNSAETYNEAGVTYNTVTYFPLPVVGTRSFVRCILAQL